MFKTRLTTTIAALLAAGTLMGFGFISHADTAGPNTPITSSGPNTPVTSTGPNTPVTSSGPNTPVTSTGPNTPVTSSGPTGGSTGTGGGVGGTGTVSVSPTTTGSGGGSNLGPSGSPTIPPPAVLGANTQSPPPPTDEGLGGADQELPRTGMPFGFAFTLLPIILLLALPWVLEKVFHVNKPSDDKKNN